MNWVLRQKTTEVMLDFTLEAKNKSLRPVIFMHGLLGQKQNWRYVAKMHEISEACTPYCVSLRNHGFSDWHESMDHEEMAHDVLRFADQQGLEKFTVLGHSMGGRVAMTLAGMAQDRLSGVIVVDAPPIDFTSSKNKISSGTIRVIEMLEDTFGSDFKGLKREEVIKILKSSIEDNAMRDFIWTNIDFDEQHLASWRCNFKSIFANTTKILSGFKVLGQFNGPALILEGSWSVRIGKEGYTHIFPSLKDEEFVVVEGAGHWVHADKPYDTAKAIGQFLKNN